MREIINALRWLVRAGAGWEMLPKDFPPWQTVYWWFRRLMRRFLFHTIHDLVVMIDRELQGREAFPTAGVIDSQSVKARLRRYGGMIPVRRSTGTSVTSRSIRTGTF